MMEVGDENTWFTECLPSSRVIITWLFGRKVNDGSWRRKYVVYRMLTLLEYHADLNIKDSNGNTPLALAREIGAKEVEDLLLQWMKSPRK